MTVPCDSRAGEPIPSRCVRWSRRNRRRLAVAGPIVLALGASAYSLESAQLAALRRDAEVKHWVDLGRRSAQEGQLELASSQFATAARLAEGDFRLKPLVEQIKDDERLTRSTKKFRDQADRLLDEGERLRFSVLGFTGDSRVACRRVERALAGFSITEPDWINRPAIQMLDETRRSRLIGTVNDLLFLWVVALDGTAESAPRALRLCDAGLAFAIPVGPWRALRDRCAGRDSPARRRLRARSLRATPKLRLAGAFQWALLSDLEGKTETVVAWLEQATRRDQRDYWSHFYLGDYCGRIRQNGRAMERYYQAAVALRPDSPWARCNRALLYHSRGRMGPRALDDLNRALASPEGNDLPEARLVLGLVKQVLGDDAGARAAYDAVIATGPGNPFASAGRLNRAKLDIDAGDVGRAWAEYDALLAADPRDVPARLSRALLALRFGRAAQSNADLTILLQQAPERADEILAARARARLALGAIDGAESDAAGRLHRRKPSPSRERLWIRTLLARSTGSTISSLARSSGRPDDSPEPPGPLLQRRFTRGCKATRFARLGRSSRPATCRFAARLPWPSECPERSVCRKPKPAARSALTPDSPDAYLIRARVRRRLGDRQAALEDVEAGTRSLAGRSAAPGIPRYPQIRDREPGRCTDRLRPCHRPWCLAHRANSAPWP